MDPVKFRAYLAAEIGERGADLATLATKTVWWAQRKTPCRTITGQGAGQPSILGTQ
jgi:hypothetical protein